MKQKIKWITRFVTLSVVLMLSGCEKDLYEDSIKQKNELSLKNVSLKDLSKKENSKLFKTVDKVQSKVAKSVGKMVYDSINNFYFDDENGRIIETNGYKSYTFPIYRINSDGKTENLLFTENEIGEYDSFIVKYDFTDEELKTLTQQQLMTKEVVYIPLETGRMSTLCVETYIYAPIDQGELTGNFGYGWVLNSLNCTAIGATDNQSHNESSGSSSISSTSSSGGNGAISSEINNIFTTPIVKSQYNPTTNVLNLSTAQISWLNSPSNIIVLNNIMSYVTSQGFNILEGDTVDAENQVFFQQAINQMIQNPGVFNSITPFVIEKHIGDINLDPCTKEILDSLKELEQNDIAKILSKFNNAPLIVKPGYNTSIIIQTPINGEEIKAQTDYITVGQSGSQPSQASLPFNYTISINPNYLNGTMNGYPIGKPTKLAIASVLLHEFIHAYFNSLFDDCNIYGNCTEIKSFPELWNEYLIKKSGNPSPTDADHLTIATNFTNILASALKEYHTGNPVLNDPLGADQVYVDLAYVGLPESEIILKYPLGSAEHDRFIERYLAEHHHQSSPQTTPLSTTCP